MEGIHVLVVVYIVDDKCLIKMGRKGRLDKNTVNVFILVKAMYERKKLLFCSFCGKSVDFLIEAHLFTGKSLVSYVNL